MSWGRGPAAPRAHPLVRPRVRGVWQQRDVGAGGDRAAPQPRGHGGAGQTVHRARGGLHGGAPGREAE